MVTGDRGAQIVDLRAARVGRVGEAIARYLEGGHVIADVTRVGNVEEWRAAARAVASDRGWRVRTGLTPDGTRVWAVRIDREVTDTDRAVLRDRLGYLGALLDPR
jgi:hypothetical protein